MGVFRSAYDPQDTETFQFFGSPIAKERITPVRTFYHDIANVVLSGRLIGVVLSVFRTDRPIDELYLLAPSVFSLAWFTFWSVLQVPVVFTVLGAFILTVTVVSGFIALHDILIWRWIQGPQLQVWPPQLPQGYNPRHRWVYINGIATGETITRQNLECLAQTFHNPVLAVNNRTYGFLGDILECIVQRAFGFHTKETGILLDAIKRYLLDTSVDKVVFIAHSQGGIIASQVLDELFADLSSDEVGKLEVYTFGSAALTFRNPYKDKSHTERVIPVLEHYCNKRDMVTSWGALSSKTTDREDLPYIGKVFVFEGQSGHMLNQHYLKYMFTGPPSKWRDDNFQLRAIRRSKTTDKFYVTGSQAKTIKGGESVQDLSHLWTYL